MKIIAKAQYNYIVEISEEEIANIKGEYRAGRVDPGQEINLCQAWKDLRKFREAKQQIESASEMLASVAKLANNLAVDYTIEEEPPMKEAE